jgi:predicted phage terminase large subunit-like protein
MAIDIKNIPAIDSQKELLRWLRGNLGDLNSYHPEQIVQLSELMEDVSLDAAREDFYTFCELMYPQLMDEKPVYGRHLEIMAEALQDMYEARERKHKRGKKLMINMPPRSSKSLMSSVLFPLWCLGKNPRLKVVVIMANRDLVSKNIGASSKRLMECDLYRQVFPGVKMSKDVRSTGHWATSLGGYYKGFGREQGKAGWGADLLLVDDLISEQEGDSLNPELLDGINESFGSGIISRRNPNAMVGVIMTRWAANDICGYMIAKDTSKYPWKQIVFPAILDDVSVDLLRRPHDPPNKYVAGGSYWPERWDLEDLEEVKAISSESKWEAVYLQDPRGFKGDIFSDENIQDWNQRDETGKLIAPKFDLMFISVDAATNEKVQVQSSFTAFEVWGVFGKREVDIKGREFKAYNVLLVNAFKGKWGGPKLFETIRETAEKYPEAVFLVENKSAGIHVIQALSLEGIPIIPYNPGTDSKIARAHAAAPFTAIGRVHVPKSKEFGREFMKELIGFPNLKNNDYVDCFTQMMLYLRDRAILKQSPGITSAIDGEDDDKNVVPFKKRTTWSRV